MEYCYGIVVITRKHQVTCSKPPRLQFPLLLTESFFLKKSCTWTLADLGGAWGTHAPPWASKFFRFHAVFGKIWRVHAPPGGFTPPLGKILDPPLLKTRQTDFLIFWIPGGIEYFSFFTFCAKVNLHLCQYTVVNLAVSEIEMLRLKMHQLCDGNAHC